MSKTNDNKHQTTSSHSSYHSSSHSSGGRHHHHHHHSKKYKYYKSSHDDFSSEKERRGENIIYNKVRKEKIKLMFKRSIFCLIVIALLIFIIYSMTRSNQSHEDFDLFNKGVSTEEINEMKNKVINYEYYIEELEERLSKYEEVESILE